MATVYTLQCTSTLQFIHSNRFSRFPNQSVPSNTIVLQPSKLGFAVLLDFFSTCVRGNFSNERIGTILDDLIQQSSNNQ
ncbi:hypothetical protein BJP37_02790 [Moorena bouillonii PNG]|uniref:Uncharacterized protein n=1 Tax=Moorena bouillonii PNG TaxID=568701 RepID=A0A1U7MWN2_9CYAN|nr:hypothetical protein BJP37_02790 [Moorena bouillonii PNG]